MTLSSTFSRRIVPSQVVEYIEEAFYGVGEHTNFDSPFHADIPAFRYRVATLVAMLDLVPNSLLPKAFNEYFANLTTIRVALQQEGNKSSVYKVQLSRDHPIPALLRLLKECPDEALSESVVRLPFLNDPKFESLIVRDIGAAERAFENGEWKAATVLAGSVIECCLLDAIIGGRSDTDLEVFLSNVRKSMPKIKDKKPDEWHLEQLLACALQLELIDSDLSKLLGHVQGYRNLIHPGRETRKSATCSRGTAHVAIGAVHQVIDRLSKAADQAQ